MNVLLSNAYIIHFLLSFIHVCAWIGIMSHLVSICHENLIFDIVNRVL